MTIVGGGSLRCRFVRTIRSWLRTLTFVFEVLPNLPAQPFEWFTPTPDSVPVRYPSSTGQADAVIRKPPGSGPFPGVVLSLGVIPVDLDHPQLERLQNALARAGFAVLVHWSPGMRSYRLLPEESIDLATAYAWMIEQPYIDESRSGFIGTCVGGSFALLAATDSRIRNRISFLAVFAPYGSMRTLARDIASATKWHHGERIHWDVDPLSRRVFEESLIAALAPDEAILLREMVDAAGTGETSPSLSVDAAAVLKLLRPISVEDATDALNGLHPRLQERLTRLSPISVLDDLQVPLIALMHDNDDPVIPPSESLFLRHLLQERTGFRYTRFSMFRHLDPTVARPTLPRLAEQLARFCWALYPLFERTTEN